MSLIDMLLDAGAQINTSDKMERTAIMHAVAMNDVEIIQFLIEKGADVHCEDMEGETALSLAQQNLNYPILGILIDAGADAKKKNRKGVALADIEDTVLQNIINGERVELPLKRIFPSPPNDLKINRSRLFGRSNPENKIETKEEHLQVLRRKNSTQEVSISQNQCASFDTEDEFLDDQPSTSSLSFRRRSSLGQRGFNKDDISCLDYLTRLRLSKVLDEGMKWQQLAANLNCDHMVELITICSDDSSPTMILLDQFEQLPNAKISRVRTALENMKETEAIKLIDGRFIY